ncbi:unnamed protein product [Clonostachys chloroleuca]|uniref:Uncharacterized protein n=1 Tax=Clonostachys chloroleuca TaxID=1926264 RepID=A0AA35M8W0_9HYPO|nr:unnamed protein product [Clonostachys chloroleuca]
MRGRQNATIYATTEAALRIGVGQIEARPTIILDVLLGDSGAEEDIVGNERVGEGGDGKARALGGLCDPVVEQKADEDEQAEILGEEGVGPEQQLLRRQGRQVAVDVDELGDEHGQGGQCEGEAAVGQARAD